MSLLDVTTRCFQSGVSERNWASMCRIFRTKNFFLELQFERDLSNSVLFLFNSYPADPALQAYLTYALNNGLLSLPTLVATFFEAAKSFNFRDSTTIDAICHLIQDEYYKNGLVPTGLLLRDSDATPETLEIIKNSLSFLRIAQRLAIEFPSPFRDSVSSSSELVALLLSSVTDLSQIPISQAMSQYADVMDLLQSFRFSLHLQRVLEQFALHLSMILGDDSKMAQEAQMIQTMQATQQYSLSSEVYFKNPNAHTDLITGSLLLRQLVGNRTSIFGSGNTRMAVALLVAAFRWTSWPPKLFYAQIFLAATTILAQASANHKTYLLWRSFIVTRMTHLLYLSEQELGTEQIADSEWREATKLAMMSIEGQPGLLEQVDAPMTEKDIDDLNIDSSDSAKTNVSSSPPFFRTLLQYCANRTSLIDKATAIGLHAEVDAPFNTQLELDAADSGQELEVYLQSKLAAEANNEEALMAFLQRAIDDLPNHPQLSEAIQKRIEGLCQQQEVEGLGHLCKALTIHNLALDIISLHVNITDILANVLAFVDDFDVEVVGDPQTAVCHLGNVILFLQSTFVRYQLSTVVFTLGDRILKTDYLLSTSSVFRRSQLAGEDVNALVVWYKALFDTSSEGIEDNILLTTKHKTLLKLSSSLILLASTSCAEGPLLNWTLVGVIKALLREILEKDFNAPVHLGVLQTLVQSPSCPQAVLCLTAHGILSLMSEPRALVFERSNASSSFNSAALKAIANRALGSIGNDSADPLIKPLSLAPQIHWQDQPRRSIRDAIMSARTGKAPALDVSRCVTVVGPTRFITMLWEELSAEAQVGDIEISRRLATAALLAPPVGRVPPLLPIFFGNLMHTLLARIDKQMLTEQKINTELLVTIITSTLTGVLQIEWALRAMDLSQHPIGQPSVAIAKRLAADLKRNTSLTAAMVMQRLSSQPTFVTNFPMMVA